MATKITNQQTGETITLQQSVTHQHPAWVHDQCGTSSESELQDMLGQYSVEAYYDDAGNHRGPDAAGISMYRD